MKRTFKAHPLMILKFVKPFLFVLLLPVIKGVLQYLTNKTVDGVLGLEIFLFMCLTAIGILRWQSFSLICNEQNRTVTIKSGFLFKRTAKINIAKLSSVQTTKSPLDMIFRSVTYKINTEAGNSRKSDFEFKLSVKNSKIVSDLLYGKGEPKAVKFSFLKIAVLAATTSSAATGILIGVPIINRAGNLLGIGLSDMLLNEINNLSLKVKTYFPPVVNAISLIILFSFLISFLYSFFKYINFRLYLEKDKMEVRSGFIIRARTSFRKSAVNNIKVEQTVLMMLLKRFAMKVSVGGYGDVKSESQVIIPLGRNKEIKNRLSEYFPFFLSTEKGIHPNRSNLTKSRFLFWPAIYFIGVSLLAIWSSQRFEDLTRFILFLTAVLCSVVVCYAYVCLFEYNKGRVAFGDSIFARSNKGLRTYELYCPKENIGEIKLIRFPTDYLYKTCRIKISVRSENADSIRVRHLDYQKVKDEVYKCFNIE